MAARSIEIEIVADTSQLQRALMRAELRVTRSWWRRLCLKLALWRLEPNPRFVNGAAPRIVIDTTLKRKAAKALRNSWVERFRDAPPRF